MPIAWKDLFDLEGEVTTCGSRIFANLIRPPAGTHPSWRVCAAAGMVSIGHTNMSEFAFSGVGLNPHYGTPRNSCSPSIARIPGGSSSGSAVAVARGIVPVSIGTDTSGSIRVPAAYNGIVGYKASRGRYSMRGVFPLASSLDSLGPVCRTVQDAAWIDAAMRGRMVPDAIRGNLSKQRIIVPTNVVLNELEPGILAIFEAALDRLVQSGVVVQRLRLPAFDAILELTHRHGSLVTIEAYALHRERVTGLQAPNMDRRTVMRANLASTVTASDYIAILQARSRLIAETEQLVGRDAIIAFPTVVQVAPPIKDIEDNTEIFLDANARSLRNAALGNFLDWCGISIPCGRGEAGMPVGFLLSALRGQDDHLLSAALAMEGPINSV